MSATLSIVATPLGNLGDITLRAIDTLKEADVIACEDTRVSSKLLAHLGIQKPLIIFHAQSGRSATEKVFSLLEEEKHVALVTDAGTPGISDPGAELVSLVYERFGDDVLVVPIPGPSALTTALSGAGVPCASFIFLGFLPHKKGRETLFTEIQQAERTMVFYESPHRIEKTLDALAERLPEERMVVVARELTKIYEEFVRGSAQFVRDYFKENPDKIRGEFVVIVAP